MQRLFSLILPLAAAISLLTAPTTARAASYGIRDDGRFFSSSAIAQAEDIIRQIHSDPHHRDVLVLTYPAIPDEKLAEFKEQGKEAFYVDWARQLASENGVNGILMLLIKTPGRLQIDVGDQRQQRAFTNADRDALRARMLASLKADDNDQALIGGLRFIKQQIAMRAASGQTSSSGAGGSFLCVGIAILLIVFFVIRAASANRGYTGGQGYPPPPGGYPPGYGAGYGQGGYGGGGFGRGLLGGLLGGALGSWAYDRFAHGDANFPPQTGADPNSSIPPDTNYSSTGGDFGGGGDF